MKKVVVTGAGGFIGSALTRYLLRKGVVVYGVDIDKEKLSGFADYETFMPVAADFKMYNRLSDMINDDIDVFYHFAWQGGMGGVVFKNYATQIDNAKYACEAMNQAIQIGCKKFVFAGTVNEYEMDKYIHLDYFEPRYTYIYSSTKQLSEAICKTLAFNNEIQFCAGRIAMAYGENNPHNNLSNVVMKNLVSGIPCKLIEGNDLYDMVYIDDIVKAFEAIGERGKDMKSYYIGHRTVRTFKEIIKDMAHTINPKCELQFGAYPDAPSGVDYKNIDIDALYNDTGFECKSDFRESIIKTAEYIASAPDNKITGGGVRYLLSNNSYDLILLYIEILKLIIVLYMFEKMKNMLKTRGGQ